MAFKVIVKPKAIQDLDDALSWYHEQKEGLEVELFHEIFNEIDYISGYPKHFQKKYKNFRIRYTDRFQFGIHYTIEK